MAEEIAFENVERIVRLVAFDNVALTLLLVWTGLNKAYCNSYFYRPTFAMNSRMCFKLLSANEKPKLAIIIRSVFSANLQCTLVSRKMSKLISPLNKEHTLSFINFRGKLINSRPLL